MNRIMKINNNNNKTCINFNEIFLKNDFLIYFQMTYSADYV